MPQPSPTPIQQHASTPHGLHLRRPRRSDAAGLHELVASSKTLDLNSPYAYLLLCTHFSETSAVVEAENGFPLGFLGGYLKPSESSVLFVWQIAVVRAARGHGIGKQLLQDVLNRPSCRHVRYLEATVTPSNAASLALFRSFARTHRAECHETPMFAAEDFGRELHEEEVLLHIGPLRGPGDRT